MQARPKRKSRSGLLSGLFYVFLLLLALVGGAATYLIVNPPSDLIRQAIAEQVKARTGRDLVVAGPASITFYPGVGVSLQHVALSAPPGMTGNLLTMQALDISVKAMPLLRREVDIKRLVLTKPVFDLRITKTGKRNWDFAAGESLTRLAQAGTAADQEPGVATDASPSSVQGGRQLPTRLRDIKHLQLDDVRIVDGTMRLTDERNGKVQEVKAVNVNLGLKSLQSPLNASGNIAWKGERVDFDGKLSNANTVLEEKPARLTFNASNRHFNAAYDGTVFIKDGADLEGRVTANANSARDFASWLGTALPPAPGFGPLSITGTLLTKGNTTTFSNAKFSLDGATGDGTVSVRTGGARPYVNANLKITELDLNKYLVTGSGVIATQPGATAPGGDAAAPGEADQIENLLNNPGTKVYGAAQRAGWSSDAFNLTLLNAADADAKLQLGRLMFRDIKVGQSALTVALKNRVMKTSFDDVRLYDGRGTGFMNVDATGGAAVIGANILLDNASAQPLLTDAAGINWLSGKANIALQLAATGTSQLQLVESLNGKSELKFKDGAISGFNVAGAVRGFQHGNLSGLKAAPSEKTDFSEMKATFNITNGVAHNQDLTLVSPLLRVTGAGDIHLPPRTIDYTLKPKLVASLQGQESQDTLSGLEIPVHISGPWSNPKYDADLKGVLSNPDKAVETVKELGKRLKGKNAGEIVDELFGSKKDDGTSSGESGSNAKDLLNKFLKKSQ